MLPTRSRTFRERSTYDSAGKSAEEVVEPEVEDDDDFLSGAQGEEDGPALADDVQYVDGVLDQLEGVQMVHDEDVG